MVDLKLKQGDRRIVNGIERAYHGSFNCGTHLDFIRQIHKKQIEYCTFSKLKSDGKTGLVGEVVAKNVTEPLDPKSICFGDESIDLFTRGKRILQIGVAV